MGHIEELTKFPAVTPNKHNSIMEALEYVWILNRSYLCDYFDNLETMLHHVVAIFVFEEGGYIFIR